MSQKYQNKGEGLQLLASKSKVTMEDNHRWENHPVTDMEKVPFEHQLSSATILHNHQYGPIYTNKSIDVDFYG